MMNSQNTAPDKRQEIDRDRQVDIAVIGAGIAGLTCAEQLRQAGYSVVVVEKSRGFGGRAATKRLPNFRADHGIRYLDRSGRLVPVLIDALRDRGVLEPWKARFCRVTPDGAISPEALPQDKLSDRDTAQMTSTPPPNSINPIREIIGISNDQARETTPASDSSQTPRLTRYIAPAGANAIGKYLAQNLAVWRSRRAIGLEPNGDRWQIQLEAVADGVDAPLSVAARAVVSAVPAPQALNLLATTATIAPEIKTAIAAASYHPCISVMAGYPIAFAEADRVWDALQFEADRDLFWAGVESTKRDADRFVLTVHAAPEFASEQFDTPDLVGVGQALLDRLASYFPALVDQSPEFITVHRWRYAFVDRPFEQDCLSTRSPLPLVLGGDWCGTAQVETAQVETAIRSGLAMAAEVARSVDGRSLPTLSAMLDLLGSESR